MQQPWALTYYSRLWRTSAVMLVAFVGANLMAALAPTEVWSMQAKTLDAKTLQTQLAALDESAHSLPPQLQIALQFQKVFLQIISGAPDKSWRPELEKLAKSTGSDPASQPVIELARLWLARVKVQDYDAILKKYYRMKVAFPPSLAEVAKDIPAELQKDPWGDPWVYRLTAPMGFAKETDQRYVLVPTRFPQMVNFKDSVRKRTPPTLSYKITLKNIGNGPVLEFRALSSSMASGLLQPGGPAVGGLSLLFIGDRWALMANQDQLFTVPL